MTQLRHKATGKIYEVQTDPAWTGPMEEGKVCCRTVNDWREEHNKRLSTTNSYIQEPLTDFEEIKSE